MSVINDMLRDLNHRQAPEVAEGRSGSPQSLIEPQKNTFKTLLFVLVFILFVAGITTYWFANLSASLPADASLTKQNAAPENSQALEQQASQAVDAGSSEVLAVAEQKVLSDQKVLPEQNLAPEKRILSGEELEAETTSSAKTPLVQEQNPVPEITVSPEKRAVAEKIKSESVVLEPVVSKRAEVANANKPNVVAEKVLIEASAKARPLIEPNKAEAVPLQTTMQVSLSPNARDQQMAEQALNLFARGKEAQAYRELVAFIAGHEVDTESRSVLANYLLQENRLAEAGDVLLNAPIQTSPALRQLKARWYAAKGDDKMALYTLNSILPEIKHYPDYYVLLAVYYQRFGWHKEAIQTYLALVEYDDSVADWWAGLGLAADRNKDLKQAALAYQQAIELPGLAPELANFIKSRLKQLQAAQRSS